MLLTKYREKVGEPSLKYLSRGLGLKKSRPRPRSFLLLLIAAACTYNLVDILLNSKLVLLKVEPGNGTVGTGTDDDGSPKPKQYSPACPIPQLDPYDKAIEHFVRGPTPPKNCEMKYKRLFKSTLDSTIIPEKGEEYIRKEGWESCCYRTVERNMSASKPDDNQTLSSECFPLSFTNSTKIPDAHEFIAIFCEKKNGSKGLVPVDVHAFVPLQPKLTRENKAIIGGKGGTGLNVVIFGLDSLSRMNFLRAMPLTHSYLMNELGGVDMAGYNNVGGGSWESLMPLLTGKSIPELDPCLKASFNDGCPFIWKNYSDSGYRTFLSDDHHFVNYFGKGFHTQPTEGYPHPLTLWANAHVGSHSQRGYYGCYGPRSTDQLLLNYLEKAVHGLSESNQNFFHFSWITWLAHDDQASARLGDPGIAASLKWMKESGYLDKTVFILMSDHGIRVGEFRNTIQGELERRLPTMFFAFPEQFRKKYSRAYRNLVGNGDKLVTVFDLHETLLDILHLENIQDATLETRELANYQAERNSSLPRGLSLFLPIPESRTCAMAGIDVEFCSCNYMRRTSLQNPILPYIANVAVGHINSLLSKHPQCAPLQLHNVTMAQRVGWGTDDQSETYTVNFHTKPGGGEFEAMVYRKGRKRRWTVQGTIDRTNWYGNQSRCVEGRAAKPYCYCTD